MWDAVRIDIQHSLRGLRRTPGFTFVVILTAGLSIGAVATIASLLNAIVLRTVTAPDPHRLVAISLTDPRTSQRGSIYRETFAAYRGAQQSLATVAMYRIGAVRVVAGTVPVDSVGEGVTPEYFGLLGASPAAGRFFTDDDGAAPIAVLSDRFLRRLGVGDAAALIGTTVKMNAQPVTIVGVAAPGFDGLQFDGGSEVFLPIATLWSVVSDSRPLRSTEIIGRLAPGVTLSAARAELRARWPAIQQTTLPSSLSAAERQSLDSQRANIESIASGFSTLRRLYGPSLTVLIALAVTLALVGCVNLAGLLLARSFERRHQTAMRLALGASRARIVQQVLVDGVLLALGGFVASLPFAWWLIRVLTAMMTIARGSPLQQHLTPDGRVLAVMTAFALLVGVAIAVLPAWRAARFGLLEDLRGRAMVRGLGRSGRRLLVGQVALSIVLVVSAMMFSGTLWRLRANDASLHARRIVWTRLSRTPGDREPITATYLRTLLGQLERIQGADAAALSSTFPAYLGFPGELPTERYSSITASDGGVNALTEFVSPGFFDLFGIQRLRGRDVSWTDAAGAPQIALVSESFARALFADRDPIGRQLRRSSGQSTKDLEIVGIVADTAIGRIRDPHQPVVFRPMLQEPTQAEFPLAHVRVTGDLKRARDDFVRTVDSHGRHFVRALFTAREWVDFSLLQERLTAGLASFAGFLTVVLACIGVYGLSAYTVTARTTEIGVRLAIGATRATIVRMIVRQGLAIAVPGVVIGIPCAMAAARLVRSQFYGVDPGDPLTMAGAAGLFVLVAALASLVPALRASRITPLDALRAE